jgi:hypothetical protein
MSEVKKKKLKNNDEELVDLLKDFIIIIKGSGDIFTKSMVDSMISTFTDVLVDNAEFHKMLADPKTDLTDFEPVIKRILRKNKHV